MHKNPTTTQANNSSSYITQVRLGSVISGDIKSVHSIRIDGFLTGNLSSEKIVVAEHSEIEGNISSSDITVKGYVKGDIIATGLLQVLAEAKIEGNIYAKYISVAHGAKINGKVNIGAQIKFPDSGTSSKAAAKNLK